MKAEYKIIKLKNGNPTGLLEGHSEAISEYGDQGFRVVSSSSYEAGSNRYTGHLYIIMEKIIHE